MRALISGLAAGLLSVAVITAPFAQAPDPTAPTAGSGSAEPAAGSADAPDAGVGSAEPVPTTTPDAGVASVPEAVPDAAPVETGSAAPPATVDQPSRSKDGAWLFVGGALTFITIGAVLAYSAESAEQDIRDLYVGFNGSPPEFDADTQERYDDLITEGKRYQYLAWTAFGIATGCAIGAAILFVRASKEDAKTVTITPIVTPREAGVAATIRF